MDKLKDILKEEAEARFAATWHELEEQRTKFWDE